MRQVDTCPVKKTFGGARVDKSRVVLSLDYCLGCYAVIALSSPIFSMLSQYIYYSQINVN